ncbi:hypothetical protein BKA58DRAFT_393110 [Alternaria rosae]|uniref:uncharacterized protein n=1 Tax=Alternaria rosae TaxID=1187941 RepID=UPI001E8D7C3C|nr:uncharacterized protein BKA58DRAFT_393110 [Alternaria rosae]KAH6858822.1 hypothetical protein BKA58DRAFT_393110 [Alternaria rosae]
MASAWLEKFIVRNDESPTPDSRRGTDTPVLKLKYTSLAEHRRILTAEGEKTPLYEMKRQSILGAWGSKIHVTSPMSSNQEVALIDYHMFSATIGFPLRNSHRIEISTSKQNVAASGGLGELHWKGTGMEVAGAASWELRDETSLVMVAQVDHQQVGGWITLWKEGLDAQTVEELVVVGVAQIEGYKRMIRQSKTSAVGVLVNK